MNLNPAVYFAAKERKERKERPIALQSCLILTHHQGERLARRQEDESCFLCVLCVPLRPFQLHFLG
jgi:hypothetical protein